MERTIDKIKRRSNQPDRQIEKGIINPDTGSSILMNQAGNVTVASSQNVQYKMNYSQGLAREVSFQSDTITNRKRIKADEIVINNHKLNPQVYELTDMKQLYGDPNYAIGNLTMCATVLVKAWEPNLKKWVLIRRPVRTPLFMNALAGATTPKEMDLDENISKEIDEIGNNKKDDKKEE